MQPKKYSAFLLTVLVVPLFFTQTLMASASSARHLHASACDKATATASREYGVPLDLMKAIARTESGTSRAGFFAPWPWTINVEGRGVHLESLQEAIAVFTENRNRGSTNIDVGCFQINHKWHGDEFPSIEAMLDPLMNARYAAKFLKELHVEMGNWIEAAGAYHSRDTSFSEKYLSRLLPMLEGVEQSGSRLASTYEAMDPVNTFPLLTGRSQSASKGSLFPSNTGSGRSLINVAKDSG